MYGIGSRKTFAAPNILKELNLKVSCSYLLLPREICLLLAAPNITEFIFLHVVLREICLLLFFPFSGHKL